MSSAADVPNHRACASCRGQKVRCIPSESNPQACERCARTGRPCVVTPLQKRKQRKRTDTRVAELESQMRALRAALKEKEEAASTTSAPGPAPPVDPAPERASSPSEPESGPRKETLGLWYKDIKPNAPIVGQSSNGEKSEEDQSTNTTRPAPDLWPWHYQNNPRAQVQQDVIDRGVISMATARNLFETYRRDLFPHYPMVAVPDSVSAEQMRREKPTLFLAIISAAASKENADLSNTLDREALQAYSTRSLMQSEKNLELVQALLVSAVWYHPPTKFGQLKYYEYIHMAATMAMDIGIGTRPTARRAYFQPQQHSGSTRSIQFTEDNGASRPSVTSRPRSESPETANVESRRTILACYILCTAVSLSLRRPNMLRVSSYIRECTGVVERSPDALPTDITLVAWVRLIIIAEDISVAFGFDEPCNMASIADLRTQLMLKDFEKRLSAWYHDLPEAAVGTGSVLLIYYTIRLYLFEIALHVDHSPHDFRAPYQMGSIQVCKDAAEVPTQALGQAIADCISSAHSLLDTFVSMDAESCRALPVFAYVRISFAAFVLAKLCLSAAHPQSRIGTVLDRGSLQADRYMDRSLLHVREIVGERRSRVPAIFLALLFKLRQWSFEPENLDPEQNFHQKRSITRGGVLRNGQQQAIDLGVPRVTEHISSSESSPQTMGSDPYQSSGNMDASSSIRSTSTPMSSSSPMASSSSTMTSNQSNTAPKYDYPRSMSNNSPATQNFTSASSSARVPYAPNSMPANTWPVEQMAMDNNLMQLLNETNAFAPGGLTGLEDWSSIMPMDFSGMDMSTWTIPEEG